MGFRPDAFQRWLSSPVGETSMMRPTDGHLPVLVVGAGPAGLAAMAALRRAGVAFEAVESHGRLGGIWDDTNPISSVYDGVHTVTSRLTTHLGTQMPRDWPRFVPHHLAHRYLLDFAEREDLVPHIRFQTHFRDATKTASGSWRVLLESEDGPIEREVRAIVVATGSHNRNHRSVPQDLWDDAVSGGIDAIHSADYRDADRYAGKRVLVVGIGNSATDIAVRVSAVAARTILSVRTPPWILPASVLGRPADKVKMSADALHLPHWYQVRALGLMQRLTIGSLAKHGLPEPSHPLLDRVPVTDRGIVDAIRSGAVLVRSNVTALSRGSAKFEDARHGDEAIDAVIFATGFHRSYPLMSGEGGDEGIAKALSYFIFHRGEPGLLFMTELVGPRSCWPIFVAQAEAIAAYFAAEQRVGDRIHAFNSRRCLPTPNLKGRVFAAGDIFHVDYGLYTRTLAALTAWLSRL